MPETGVDRDVTVLVVPRNEHPVDGLLGGVLVEQDQVLVPAPHGLLLDESREFEVLIFSTRRTAENPIERIRPTQVDLGRLGDDRDRPAVALIKLAHRSRYLPMFRQVDGCEFDRLFAENHDIWRTMAHLDLVPAQVPNRVPDDFYRLEEQQRRVVRRELIVPGGWVCPSFLPNCHPCPPRLSD